MKQNNLLLYLIIGVVAIILIGPKLGLFATEGTNCQPIDTNPTAMPCDVNFCEAHNPKPLCYRYDNVDYICAIVYGYGDFRWYTLNELVCSNFPNCAHIDAGCWTVNDDYICQNGQYVTYSEQALGACLGTQPQPYEEPTNGGPTNGGTLDFLKECAFTTSGGTCISWWMIIFGFGFIALIFLMRRK